MPSDKEKFTRRGFITKLAKDGAKVAIPLFLMNHLYGCAHDPFKQDPEDFTIANFDRWYKRNRLYNGSNPNLDGHRTMHTFKLSELSQMDGLQGLVMWFPMVNIWSLVLLVSSRIFIPCILEELVVKWFQYRIPFSLMIRF